MHGLAKGPEKATTDDKGVADVQAGDDDRKRLAVPTMTVYPPRGRNTGAAMVVFPGGGYEILAIDLEGTEVCDWLVERGITCVLLQVPRPCTALTAPNWGAYPQSPIALEDAQRTLGLVRLHAAEWKIDPHKVGVLGFSAGGHLVAAISTRTFTTGFTAGRVECVSWIAKAAGPTSPWPSTRGIYAL